MAHSLPETQLHRHWSVKFVLYEKFVFFSLCAIKTASQLVYQGTVCPSYSLSSELEYLAEVAIIAT
jgi:predicted ATP-grasp superfamily ATP-dependent carboligase